MDVINRASTVSSAVQFSLTVIQCNNWHKGEYTCFEMSTTPKTLMARKQQLVRDAVSDAAIELFAAKGFDETTVDEIAEAAGVSRRSFFRYFASKDDLLAQSTLNYGAALTAAIETAPRDSAPLELLREAVLSMTRHAASLSHTRKSVEIAAKSASARQAYTSRLPEVEDNLARAYAARLKSSAGDETKPRLLAGLTLTITNVAIASWFKGEYRELSTSSRHVFQSLSRLFAESAGVLPAGKKSVPAGQRRKSRTRK